VHQAVSKKRLKSPKLDIPFIPKIRGRTYPLFEDIISYPYPGPQKGYYILSISRPKKRIWIYIKSFVKNFASIVTVSEQQKARPDRAAAHKSSTFYRIKLKP
jgi:hypothetical protein